MRRLRSARFAFARAFSPRLIEGLVALVVAQDAAALNALLEAAEEAIECLAGPCPDFQSITRFLLKASASEARSPLRQAPWLFGDEDAPKHAIESRGRHHAR